MSFDGNKTLSRLQQAFKNQEEAMRAHHRFGLPETSSRTSFNQSSSSSTPQPSALSLTAPPKSSESKEYTPKSPTTLDSNFTFDLNQFADYPLNYDGFGNSDSTSTTFNHPYNDQSTSTSYSTHQPSSSTGGGSTKVVADILSDDLLDQKLATRKQSLLPTSPQSPPQADDDINPESKDDPIASQVWKMYTRQKASLPNGQRMENLTWRMMAMSLRRKRESEAAAIKVKQEQESQENALNDDNEDADKSSHSSPTPEAQPPPEPAESNERPEENTPEMVEKPVQVPDEDEERGRKPRRQRGSRKQTNVVVGFAGKVPEGLDNGEAIVDDLMEWRGKSRSRSRSVMDWRGQSRSRSRPPPGHHGVGPLKNHFMPSLPTQAPSPETSNHNNVEQTEQHNHSRGKHELTTTIEEDSGNNADNVYNFTGSAMSLPDPQTFLQYSQHQNAHHGDISYAHSPPQNFYDLIDGRTLQDLVRNKSVQQTQHIPASASLLSKSLSSTYGPQIPNQIERDNMIRKRPAEYSPKFNTLFNNTGNGSTEPPPFSLANPFLSFNVEADSRHGAEGSFGPPGIDINENIVLPEGFPDDGGLSALLSQSAPGGFNGPFPPTMPQSLPNYGEYVSNDQNTNNNQDWSGLFNLLYDAESAPTTPSFGDVMNPFAVNINPHNLFNKMNREVKPLRGSSSSQSSSRYASQSPNLPTKSKPSVTINNKQRTQKRETLSSSVPSTTSIPIAAKRSPIMQQQQQPQRSSYVPLRQAPSKTPNLHATTSTSASGLSVDPGNAMTCNNCKTNKTPLWRRDPEGNPLCNACGLFLKLHGVVRPLSLKSDVIKKRNRNGPGVNAKGGQGKKATGKDSQTTSSQVTPGQPNQQPQENNVENSPAMMPFMTLPAVVNTKKRRTSAVQQQTEQSQERQIESSIGYLSIDQSKQ
ncbi:hypothetical protein E3Q19_03034 [Wallemia mellicola]|nr:hypothetical protein E3Q19_03034 [Wallemia mellicola]TIC72876.1 hypothetical protein E3Q00_03534 [Wallemia mellicola]